MECCICGSNFIKIGKQKTCSKNCSIINHKNTIYNRIKSKFDIDMSGWDKDQVFDYIFKHGNSFFQNIKLFLKIFNIEKVFYDVYKTDDMFANLTPFQKSEMMYIYLKHKGKCLICNDNTSYSGNFKRGYYITCSKKCEFKLRSINQTGSLNTSHRMTEETRNIAHSKISVKIKQKIADGSWTPCVTNSWANSRVKLKVEGTDYEFRSTWEALFWVLNQHLEYEKIRVPYFDTVKQKQRTYITDFYDKENKTIYEVKPNSNRKLQNVIDKETSALIYTKTNGMEYVFITECYFYKNLTTLLNHDIIQNNEKLIKTVRKFKEIYENTKN